MIISVCWHFYKKKIPIFYINWSRSELCWPKSVIVKHHLLAAIVHNHVIATAFSRFSREKKKQTVKLDFKFMFNEIGCARIELVQSEIYGCVFLKIQLNMHNWPVDLMRKQQISMVIALFDGPSSIGNIWRGELSFTHLSAAKAMWSQC